MMLYERTFPLKKGLSFSRYIKNLDQESFPPYTLLINEIDHLERCEMEIMINDVVLLQGSANAMFMRGVLFKKCIIQYLKDERSYTLSAFVGFGNKFASLVWIIMAALMFVLGLFIFIGSKSPGQALVPWVCMLIFLAPLISTYRMEKSLLDKIGFLGSDISEE
jgi:hypothetical protein